ncbi:MAG: hypothetical protein WC001_07100 [Desulfurivibrionaceae bacterium]
MPVSVVYKTRGSGNHGVVAWKMLITKAKLNKKVSGEGWLRKIFLIGHGVEGSLWSDGKIIPISDCE